VNVAAARRQLAETLAKSGIRVSLDPGRSADAPILIVTAPDLVYDAYYAEPTAATFRVPLVVVAHDALPIYRTNDQLLDLLPLVEQAIYDSEDAALTAAESGSWGSPPLPCYLLTIEVS
jgi:hypothetical protein